MTVIADTSPRNYPIWIEAIHILPALYEKILIPREVHRELTSARAPKHVRNWAEDIPAWTEVADDPEPQHFQDPRWQHLHAGERAALALAASTPQPFLLLDERAATLTARKYGMRTTETLGILDAAARAKLINISVALDRLQNTSFRCPKWLLEQLLNDHST